MNYYKEAHNNFNGINQNHGQLQRQLKASKNREKNLQAKIKKQTKEYDELYANLNQQEYVSAIRSNHTWARPNTGQ